MLEIKNVTEIDLELIAQFGSKVKRNINKSEIIRILKNNFSNQNSFIAQYYINEDLIAWFLLFQYNGKISINPSATIGPTPIIDFTKFKKYFDCSLEQFCKDIFVEINSFAKQLELEEIDFIVPDLQSDENEIDFYKKLFSNYDIYIDLTIESSDTLLANFPSNISFASIGEENPEKLEKMYIEIMEASDIDFFHNQKINEKHEYFKLMLNSIDKSLSRIIYYQNSAIGFTLVQPYDNDDCILNFIGILPEFQDMNYGKYLLQNQINDIAFDGFKSLSTGATSNMRALDFFSKNGFKLINKTYIFKENIKE